MSDLTQPSTVDAPPTRGSDMSTGDMDFPAWRPDCGGDWTLSGDGFFANCWPDNTVSASIWHGDERCATSGVVARRTRAECQAFAEQWIRENLHNAHIEATR